MEAQFNSLKPTDHMFTARGLMDAVADLVDGHILVSEVFVSRCILWTLFNEENGQQCRVVFDPQNLHMGRQGVHTVLDQDEYELLNKIEESISDGFSVVYIHLNLGAS